MGKGRGQTQVSKRTLRSRSADHSPGNLHGPSQHPAAPLLAAAPGLGTPWPGGLSSLEGVQDSVLWRPQSPALFCPVPAGLEGPGTGAGWGSLGTACLPPSLTSVLTLSFSPLLCSVNSVGPLGGKLCLLCAHPASSCTWLVHRCTRTRTLGRAHAHRELPRLQLFCFPPRPPPMETLGLQPGPVGKGSSA